uniref:Uncharacterized protein n=1 Tax=Ditylenchus dipsaci TaxID=166011 RepID=A0A915EBA0_9BILA
MAFVLLIFFLVFLLVIIVCALGIGYRRGRNHLMEAFCPARLAREQAKPKRRFRPLGEFMDIEPDQTNYSLQYPRLFTSTHIGGGMASVKHHVVANTAQQKPQKDSLPCRTQLVGGAYASAVYSVDGLYL